MKKMFVGNLPPDASEESVRNMFSAFGTVRSIHVVSDIFTGKCKGFGSVEMEGHEARAAQAALDGNMMGGSDRSLRVSFHQPRAGRGRKRR
jgi:RNA recognition motif-containing protein